MSRTVELENAIKTGNLSEIKRLTAGDPELSRCPTSMGVSGLMMALYYGQAEIALAIAETRELNPFEAASLGDIAQVRMTLKADPLSVDALSPDGFTMLGFAAYFGHAAIVEILLEAGANPNKRSENGLAVLPLHSALSSDRRDVARLLIENGTDINAAGGEGWTALHYTAHNGDIEIAELLLRLGANREALQNGKTPADLALESGHGRLAELLAK